MSIIFKNCEFGIKDLIKDEYNISFIQYFGIGVFLIIIICLIKHLYYLEKFYDKYDVKCIGSNCYIRKKSFIY